MGFLRCLAGGCTNAHHRLAGHFPLPAEGSASGRVRAFRSRTVPNMQPVGPNALPGAATSRLLFQRRSRGKSAISGFLGRGRRGPARPAADVYCKDGPPRREARVAVGEQRQGAYALRVDYAASAVGAYPPQFVPVVRVMVDEQRPPQSVLEPE